MSDEANNTAAGADAAAQPVFDVIRIYAKDCSLETPRTPLAFNEEWKPSINVEFDTKSTALGHDQVEVDLRVTVTCRNQEKQVLYICEVHQAAIFLIKNIPDQEQIEYLLAGVAPNVLFPYAREHVSSLIVRATFPPLNLKPINFEALYRARKYEEMQKQNQNQAGTQQPEAVPAGDMKPANEEPR